MLVVSKLFAPLVWLLGRITDFFLKMLGVKPGSEPRVTEEEIQLLIDQGTQAGVFEEAEQDMVEGIFSLGDQRVYELGTKLLGRAGLSREDVGGLPSGRVLGQFLQSLSLTIAAGSSQVQRNIISERILGMPKEPR